MADELKNKFQEMFSILDSLHRGLLQPAIEWATQHQAQLILRGSDLLFMLHRLNFLNLLLDNNGGNHARWVARQCIEYLFASTPQSNIPFPATRLLSALEYAKREFSSFLQDHFKGYFPLCYLSRPTILQTCLE